MVLVIMGVRHRANRTGRPQLGEKIVQPRYRSPPTETLYTNMKVGLGWHRRCKPFFVYWGWRWLATAP